MDSRELCKRVVKYVLEGLIVAIAAIILPKNKFDFEAVIALALVAASTFAIIDTMMPSLSHPVNMGVGFGIGANLVNFPGGM
jgi:ABC-type Co2+ transport system permease subunit